MLKSQLPVIFKNLLLLILLYHVQALDLESPLSDTTLGEPFTLSWTTSQDDPPEIKIIAIYDGKTPATLKEHVQTSLRKATVSIPRRPALPPGPYTLQAVDVHDKHILTETPTFIVSAFGGTTSPGTSLSAVSSTTDESTISQSPNTLASSTPSTETATSTTHVSSEPATSTTRVSSEPATPTTRVSSKPALYPTSSSYNIPVSTDAPEALASNPEPTGVIFAGVFGSLGGLFLLFIAILLYRRRRRNRRVHQHLADSGENLSPHTRDWPTQIPRTMEDGQQNETSSPSRISAVFDPRRRSEVGSTTSERTSTDRERRRRDILSEIWTVFQTEAGPRAL